MRLVKMSRDGEGGFSEVHYVHCWTLLLDKYVELLRAK